MRHVCNLGLAISFSTLCNSVLALEPADITILYQAETPIEFVRGIHQGSDGYIYGVASKRGNAADDDPFPEDFIYRATQSGDISVLHELQDDHALFQGLDGFFYGVDTNPDSLASEDCDFVYQLDVSAEFTVLHEFKDCETMGFPAAIVQASDGNLYITLGRGGLKTCMRGDCGAIIRLTPKGELSFIKAFDPSLGHLWERILIQASDGYLYGLIEAIV
ncbi:MAG: hypothetical protein F6K19_41985 [Cyanothece sp. SIO1E1]|nr:hypothetical protein [Cyanothece sp. SIO1E1]